MGAGTRRNRGAAHGEDRLIAWLRRRPETGGLIGDDAARLAAGGPWAATVDHQVEGVHFPAGLDPATAARRLLAVNLSDLAAVGAEPAYALLALAAARGFDHRRFLRALLAACTDHGTTLAGGDLSSLPEGGPRLVAGLTLLGQLPDGGAWLSRGDARAGDAIWVGGTLGESAAGRELLARGARPAGRRVELPAELGLGGGLAAAARRAVRRHLRPEPQLALGHALGRLSASDRKRPAAIRVAAIRVAAIDVSDGLARDLTRLCRESNVGAEIDPTALPRPQRFDALADRLGLDPLHLALGGGEDYVLLFTLPEGEPPPTEGCSRIGRITARRSIRTTGHGPSKPLSDLGWDHLG